MRKCSFLFVVLLLACGGGGRQPSGDEPATTAENHEAKALLQGIWSDDETGEVVLEARGDTIYYADGTSLPAYFRIVADSIELGPVTYRILKQTAHNFWFENHAGDEVRLVKGDEEASSLSLSESEPQVISTSEVVKRDSVVMYGGQRYHWYIYVNPTRSRVTRTTYTADGVGVEKVYFDNIIHVSVFKGAARLFSRDFNKQAYAADVPADFLGQSVLGNISFGHADAQGFHFYATVCIPDGESCYLFETTIGFDGHLSTKLMEY